MFPVVSFLFKRLIIPNSLIFLIDLIPHLDIIEQLLNVILYHGTSEDKALKILTIP